jgi:hypothetical protein
MTMDWNPDREAKPQGTREIRMAKLLPIEIGSERLGRVKVVVRNISPYGLGVRSDVELLACERLIVFLPGDEQVGATVRWVRKGTFGLALDEAINPAALRANVAKSLTDLTTKDAQLNFAPVHVQPATQPRPGFQRSQRDSILNGHSQWLRD